MLLLLSASALAVTTTAVRRLPRAKLPLLRQLPIASRLAVASARKARFARSARKRALARIARRLMIARRLNNSVFVPQKRRREVSRAFFLS